MTRFNAITLPEAIAELFRLNDHDVSLSREIHGAEVDIIATSKSNPFAPNIYIEATIEYVNNTKYGKDLTKFELLRRKDPGCVCISISSSGFTAPVRERSRETGIVTLTYDELFAKFEKFSSYIEYILHDEKNQQFVLSYEKPLLKDSSGEEQAIPWLNAWRSSSNDNQKWLLVLGEYGTGKTSLTRVLQYNWLLEYRDSPSKPLPLRIELRSFTRQFDARALMHHFLDTNGLGHVPVDFVFHLMKAGRVVLLLDGYDEMAQFLNTRERRACLAALAELSSHGAKGLITSRPNYFTENEELKVFEALYETINMEQIYVGQSEKNYIEAEKAVDVLVENYILNRFERNLRDLTYEQTTALVNRKLSEDPDGRALVLGLLQRVFRDEAGGGRAGLSGKPVIITYLLELVDELRVGNVGNGGDLTEWVIYKMILDRLMMRDQQRAEIDPMRRRKALRVLAVALSRRDLAFATEETFYKIIEQDFKAELRRLPSDERHNRREQLFEDLRSSSTLSRASTPTGTGWAFSHNSLREFLCVEYYIGSLIEQNIQEIKTPITDAMKIFSTSMPGGEFEKVALSLKNAWQNRHQQPRIGLYLSLVWERIISDKEWTPENILNSNNETNILSIDNAMIRDIDFGSFGNMKCDASSSELSGVSFSGLDLNGCNFSSAILDTCSFADCDLSGCDFSDSLVYECDLSDANIAGANFIGMDEGSSFIVSRSDNTPIMLSGKAALGYLLFHGAKADKVDEIFIIQHHDGFPIAEKIAERLVNQRNSQYLGLTQKGESRANPPFARGFVDLLERLGMVNIDRNRLVSVTAFGRSPLAAFVSREAIGPEVSRYFRE